MPIRRGQIHRTHGELIGVRAAPDHAALRSPPELPYLVCERRLRRVGRDCLISFAGSHYSVPARATDGRVARAGQRVELRVSADTLTICRLAIDGEPVVLAAHPRATGRGSLIVGPAHWDGLPDGHTRAVTVDPVTSEPPASPATTSTTTGARTDPLAALLTSRPLAATAVARRPPGAYDAAAGLTSPVTNTSAATAGAQR